MAVVMTGNGPRALPEGGLAPRRASAEEIPVLDLAPMFGSDAAAKAALAARLRAACTDSGFFYLRGHGVPEAVVAAAFDAARYYFALPEAAKLAHHAGLSPHNRGYAGLLEENTDPAARGDLHESFDMALEVPADDPDVLAGKRLYGPNQWPDGLSGFRETVEAYHAAMRGLSRCLLAAFALALGLDEDYFDPRIGKPLATVRLLRYPPQTGEIDPRQIGIGAHTDYECFTILAQEDVPALQVLSAAGEWLAADPIPGCFLVNIGDQMARWTNDLFASTVHRAVNRSGRERYSIPFFFGPDYDTEIVALPGCTGPDNPAKYPPVGAGAYVESRFSATFDYFDGAVG
ncbi:2OG-Fe(II) oxygenase [Acidihalobacter aeolianus]|uniref:2-oxoglutarate-dependent ethylene/succinate-forming enzyme n=1 Tax=Acidihalobacter aeolianus TaxID=2792603 RepID=A0A1D8KAM2_9GAMM|nr:2-oxoglutarate and iron-dependent oxygenase domain-containing protein [Acidihalobacter aeolianus]AOV17995.1 2OG-Fe(II) oxygenase [Acidihalobacter aeolianus]